LLQILSGLSALTGFVTIGIGGIRAAYLRIRARKMVLTRWLVFVSCAFLLAGMADTAALLVDASPAERVGAPRIWFGLAVLFLVLWLLARRLLARENPAGTGRPS